MQHVGPGGVCHRTPVGPGVATAGEVGYDGAEHVSASRTRELACVARVRAYCTAQFVNVLRNNCKSTAMWSTGRGGGIGCWRPYLRDWLGQAWCLNLLMHSDFCTWLALSSALYDVADASRCQRDCQSRVLAVVAHACALMARSAQIRYAVHTLARHHIFNAFSHALIGSVFAPVGKRVYLKLRIIWQGNAFEASDVAQCCTSS